MSGDGFRSPVPKTDPPFSIHDVDPHRQIFHQMPEQLRVIEKGRRHFGLRLLLVSSAVKAGNLRAWNGKPLRHPKSSATSSFSASCKAITRYENAML